MQGACPWCPAMLSMLAVERCGVVVLEFTADAWEHLADRHSVGTVGSA